jgi:5,10-methylenetetrahydromethanopterin reductase
VSVSLGLLLPPGAGASAKQIADRAIEAETAGFDSAWVIEDYYSWECFASLGYLAAVTSRIALGVSVTTPYVRPAPLLASAAATLDQFANGRFRLGLGRCTGPLLNQIGIDDRLPMTTLRETAEVLRLLWQGGTVSYAGKTVTIDRVVPDVLPVKGSIPILYGAIGPQALRQAGRIGDGVILTSFAPVSYVRWAARQVRAGAEEAGRDPAAIEIIAMIATRITDGADAAIDELKPWFALAHAMTGRGELLWQDSGVDLAVLAPIRAKLKIDAIVADGLEPYLHAYQRVSPDEVRAVVPADLVAQTAIVGDAAHCHARLTEYIDAGATHVIVDSPQAASLLVEALRT